MLIKKRKNSANNYCFIFLPIDIIVSENESMWKDNRYAPRRKPSTGPKAAMLYIQPET